jgi:radical SAM protein with 4Fe4S-binding SPASM domain
MCPQSKINRKNQFMDFSLFARAIDEIAIEKKDCEIWFAIMGEPLTNMDQLIKMIEYAKASGLNNLNLNTNACLLDNEGSERLVFSGLAKATIGIDAINADTYQRIRRNGDYEKTVKNTEDLLQINRQNGNPIEIIVQFIVMDENEGQENNFKEFWLERGASIKIRPKLGWGTAVHSTQLYLDEKERNFPCPWIVRTMSIHVDGMVAQCDADWDDKYNLANIKERTLKSIWNNELKAIRTKHWNLDFRSEPCCDCKDWQAGRSYFYHPEDRGGLA